MKKKTRSAPHSLIEARRLEVEEEISIPPFPDDVEAWDDGSWTCSPASFEKMAKSYRRFGFTLNPGCTFETLGEIFEFVLKASGRLMWIEASAKRDYSPAMLEYLLAVRDRDDSRIPGLLEIVLAESRQPVPQLEKSDESDESAQDFPKLRLVHTNRS